MATFCEATTEEKASREIYLNTKMNQYENEKLIVFIIV